MSHNENKAMNVPAKDTKAPKTQGKRAQFDQTATSQTVDELTDVVENLSMDEKDNKEQEANLNKLSHNENKAMNVPAKDTKAPKTQGKHAQFDQTATSQTVDELTDVVENLSMDEKDNEEQEANLRNMPLSINKIKVVPEKDIEATKIQGKHAQTDLTEIHPVVEEQSVMEEISEVDKENNERQDDNKIQVVPEKDIEHTQFGLKVPRQEVNEQPLSIIVETPIIEKEANSEQEVEAVMAESSAEPIIDEDESEEPAKTVSFAEHNIEEKGVVEPSMTKSFTEEQVVESSLTKSLVDMELTSIPHIAPLVDDEGNHYCSWCYMQLRNHKIFLHPWIFCGLGIRRCSCVPR